MTVPIFGACQRLIAPLTHKVLRRLGLLHAHVTPDLRVATM